MTDPKKQAAGAYDHMQAVTSLAMQLTTNIGPYLHASGPEAALAVCMAQAACAALAMGFTQRQFVTLAGASFGQAVRDHGARGPR